LGEPRADPEYAIPNGFFFTEAAPGQHGFGYRVANEAGIPLWDAFQKAGGVQALGYPLTRRFTWKGTTVQAFQFGVLRWLPSENRAEIRKTHEIGEAPADARRAEPPLAFSAAAARAPWSGWWWPANDVVGGPRLFDADGPLARYDKLSSAVGKTSPSAAEWERAEIRFSGLSWAGHCNGWAAASLLEPEPTTERVVNGVTFSVADQKGLLTSYHFADAAAWAAGSYDHDVEPADFHRELTRWMGRQRKGLVFTFRPSGNDEVWSFPASKLETVIGPDPEQADLWHVKTTVWLVDNNVTASYVGSQPWPGPDGKIFEYTLTGNDPYNPKGGTWSSRSESRFGRPFMIWYPDPAHRNIDRTLTSPSLEYALVRQITRGADSKPLFNPAIPPLLPYEPTTASPATVPASPPASQPAGQAAERAPTPEDAVPLRPTGEMPPTSGP
jgi:hypothetical protein